MHPLWLQQLLEIVEKRESSTKSDADLTANTVCVAVARVGASDQKICTASLKDMSQLDMGPPLHSMVIPGHMHPLEKQMLQIYSNNDEVKKDFGFNGRQIALNVNHI